MWPFGKKQADVKKQEAEQTQEPEREPFTWVSVADAQKLLASGQVQLIDVREPWEYKSAHIPGAQSVPLNTFLRKPREYIKQESVMFVCAVGERSAVACEMAAALGIARVFNIQGGTNGWIGRGLPIER